MNQDIKNRIGDAFDKFLHNDKGATAIEYGLIAAAVGLVLVAVMPAFNQATTDTYAQIVGFFD
ncbi:MAG: Flp family type IVb pilin [Rhizobiales bacterium]|nr:Flp family type IVb pilin [Hyphomicrobiales bacterium]